MQNRVAIFIDAANYHYALKKHRWKIDYTRFAEHFRHRYKVVRIYYYEGYPTKKMYTLRSGKLDLEEFGKQRKQRMNFFKFLRTQGIIVRTKPVISIYDLIHDEYRLKCNFDVELTIDALDAIDDYDEVFLCTGDGDFAKLVSYLKGKFKTVNVVSMKDRCSSLLKRAKPHAIIYLNDMKPEIMMVEKRKAQP